MHVLSCCILGNKVTCSYDRGHIAFSCGPAALVCCSTCCARPCTPPVRATRAWPTAPNLHLPTPTPTLQLDELCFKPKNWKDLLTDEPFTRKDVIVIQDPLNLSVSQEVCPDDHPAAVFEDMFMLMWAHKMYLLQGLRMGALGHNPQTPMTTSCRYCALAAWAF